MYSSNREPSAATDTQQETSHDQIVTPWEVEGAVVDGMARAIDYDRLIEQFGTRPINSEILQRFEQLTGRRPHVLLRRGIFFSHR